MNNEVLNNPDEDKGLVCIYKPRTAEVIVDMDQLEYPRVTGKSDILQLVLEKLRKYCEEKELKLVLTYSRNDAETPLPKVGVFFPEITLKDFAVHDEEGGRKTYMKILKGRQPQQIPKEAFDENGVLHVDLESVGIQKALRGVVLGAHAAPNFGNLVDILYKEEQMTPRKEGIIIKEDNPWSQRKLSRGKGHFKLKRGK